MGLKDKARDSMRRNFLLALSTLFTAVPALVLLLYFGLKYLIANTTDDALGSVLEVIVWVGMFFLAIAVAYRRLSREPSYPFWMVFTLFSAQAFIAFQVKFAMPAIFVFVVVYNLLRLYKYPGKKAAQSGDQSDD